LPTGDHKGLVKYDKFYTQWQCILVSRDELATQLYKELKEDRARKFTHVLQDKIRRMITPQVLAVFLEYGTSVAIPSIWKETYPALWKPLINRKGGNLDFFFKCIGTAISGNDQTLQFSKNVTEWAKKTVDISMAMDIGGKELFSVMAGNESQYDLDLVDLFKLIFKENPIPTLLKTLQDHIPKTTSKQANRGHQPNAGLRTTGEARHMGSSSTTMEVTDGPPQRDQTSSSQSSQSSPISTTEEHPRVPSEATPTTASGFFDEEADVDDTQDGASEEHSIGLPCWKDVEETFCDEAKLGDCQSFQVLKRGLPSLNPELYTFLEYLSEQYDLLLAERDKLKRDLKTSKTMKRKRRNAVESESESQHSKSVRGTKPKILGKENIESPLHPEILFSQNQRRSSDSNGGGSRLSPKPGKTQEITPHVSVPRLRPNRIDQNMTTPALKGTETGRNPSASSSEVASTETRKRSQNPMVFTLSRS
jgi:hypothetical protein